MGQNKFFLKLNFWLILAIIFGLPSYLVRFNLFGVPTTLLEILIYISFFLTIINYISSKFKAQNAKQQLKAQNLIHNSLFIIPITLFIIAGIIGVIVAQDKNVASGQFKAFIIDPILFFIILILNFRNEKNKFQAPNSKLQINSNFQTPNSNSKLKLIFQALILGGTLVAIHAIWQKLTGALTPDGRVVGIFGYSPNYLALYLTPIAVLIVGYEILLENTIRKNTYWSKLWPYEIALMAILLALYFSGSRAGLAVTIVSISMLLIFRWWNRIRQNKIFTLLLYFFISLLLISGWWFIGPNWQLSPDAGGRITSSNNIRWEIWQTSGKILATDYNWLKGVGLGNYQNYFSNFTKGWTNYDEYISPNALTAHNLYLQTWFNLGLLGLISFIWLLVVFFHYTLQVTRYTKNPYSLILISVMFSILLYGLIDTPYWKNDLSVMFWLILGLALINPGFRERRDR